MGQSGPRAPHGLPARPAVTACSRACPAWPRPSPSRPRHRVGVHVHPPPVHPDLLPADIVGTSHLPGVERAVRRGVGPIFANFVPADEVNRAPARSSRRCSRSWPSSACRSAARPSPPPTSSSCSPPRTRSRARASTPARGPARPLPHEGGCSATPAGRGGRDRLPDGRGPLAPSPVLTPEDVLRLQAAADAVYVDRAVVDWRGEPGPGHPHPAAHGLADIRELIAHGGASPRASLACSPAPVPSPCSGAAALPQDVFDGFPDALRHRLVLPTRRWPSPSAPTRCSSGSSRPCRRQDRAVARTRPGWAAHDHAQPVTPGPAPAAAPVLPTPAAVPPAPPVPAAAALRSRPPRHRPSPAPRQTPGHRRGGPVGRRGDRRR